MARTFEGEDLQGARFRDVDMRGAQLRGAWMADVEIDGIVEGMVVNGVDVGPLIEAELDRRHPERALLRYDDLAGAAGAWDAVGGLWAGTIERARLLPEPLLHERVDDEWSFLETLRHLVFVVDAWVSRPVLGADDPYWPGGVAHDVYTDGLPLDRDLDPGLDEVVGVWTGRWEVVGRVIADARADGADLDAVCPQNPAPGYPPFTTVPLRACLHAALWEPWHHRRYAERDLVVLEGRAS